MYGMLQCDIYISISELSVIAVSMFGKQEFHIDLWYTYYIRSCMISVFQTVYTATVAPGW
uniref:Uncharacterized protein n=1 Tax=Arundo donax TaxID=35708 RepID=A0A0A9C873_ARUDO